MRKRSEISRQVSWRVAVHTTRNSSPPQRHRASVILRFSKNALVELFKAILKTVVVGFTYLVVMKYKDAVIGLSVEPLKLDICATDAAQELIEQLAGGVDIVVHNAGITRLPISRMGRWVILVHIPFKDKPLR